MDHEKSIASVLKLALTCCFILVSSLPYVVHAQSFDLFHTVDQTPKKYSLYFPNDFDEAKTYKLVVAFHPWNVERWNAESWRDTLITFADANDVILFCPDGGKDGKVDDSITLKLTDQIIQTLLTDYQIDENHIYALGFSW